MSSRSGVFALRPKNGAPLAMARFMFTIYSSRTARHNVSPASVNNFIEVRERNKADGGEMRPSYNDESRISFRRRTKDGLGEEEYSEHLKRIFRKNSRKCSIKCCKVLFVRSE